MDPVAASYSMKPASIPSMTLPSTAIPAATAAQKWIEDRWGHVTGKSEYIAFVEDPYDAGNKESVLRVNYPKGTYAHSDVGEGGVGMYLNPFGSGVQRAMFTYEVAFSKGWDFVEGGKLLGLFGGRVGEHCSGGIYTDTCFSTRIVWRADGDAEVYAYVPSYAGFDTASDIIASSSGYGYSVNRGSWRFSVGDWQKVSIVVVLNSDPSSSSTEANGVLSIYFNDKHVFTHNYFIFTTKPSVDISSIFFSTFFGGSSEKYASKGGYAYFRNMKSYYSNASSTATGHVEVPTYPS
ncbi:hypothetical protein CPB85DRAFT_1441769 [Mucidula mucida]|nr:hypothetical protein CPB85DRAFT_1441769 [Mucidula mucida]